MTELMEPSVNVDSGRALLASNYSKKKRNYLGFTLSRGESTRKKLEGGDMAS